MSDSSSTGQFFKTIKIIGGLFTLFVIFVIIRGGILAQIHESKKEVKNEIYFESFNKYFKGVVVKIKRRPPKEAGGIRPVCYKIRLIESTSRYYRPSKRTSEFFCVIDFPYAEVMTKDYGDAQIGDSCFFNGSSDCFGIKIGNQKWRRQPTEIGNYPFLKKPYTSIARYDSAQLVNRKNFYPRKQSATIDQINFYWQNNCKKDIFQENIINYNMIFYNYETWLKESYPRALKKQMQPYFYMIQVAEYIDPLDMDTLIRKFKGEPVIWVKNKGLNKYFINKKIQTLKKAEEYLRFLKDTSNLDESNMAVIKKIKRKPDKKPFYQELNDESLAEEEADIQTIPYQVSILRFTWLIFIFFTFINVLSQWTLAGDTLKKDKEFAKGFRHYVIGLLFFFNIWLVIIGIGIETGWVDSIFDFMYVKRNPIVIAANVYLILLLFTISRWVFVGDGAKILARLRQYPSGIFSPVHTEDGIRLLWSIYVFLGLIFIFARLFF